MSDRRLQVVVKSDPIAHRGSFTLRVSRWVQTPGMARDHFLGAAWITVLISLAFLPTVFTGVPVASGEHLRKIDRILAAAPIPAAQPISLFEETAALYRHPMMQASVYDPSFYWIDLPNDVLQSDAFRHGELPLWNPYSGLGTPLLATGQTAAFFPLKLIVYLTSVASGYSAFLIARLWVAGFATYGFARSAGMRHAGALLAATGYALSGFVVTHFHNVESSPATMLPLAFWAAERVIRAPRIATGVALGMALGNVNLSGHPESALFGGISAGAFAIARVVQVSSAEGSTGWRSRVGRVRRPVFALALGAIVGGAITAIVAVPLLERMALGAGSLLSRPPATSWADAGRNVFIPIILHALSALVNPQQQYNTYVGPMAVAFTAIAFRHASSRPLVRALGLTIATSAGLLLTSRESEVFTILPVGVNAFYGVAPLSLCLATLAGVGLDQLLSCTSTAGRLRPLTLPALTLASIIISIWELAHDGSRAPSLLLGLAPLFPLTAIVVTRTRGWMRRTARGCSDLPLRLIQIESSIIGAGTGLAFIALASWGVITVYQTWLGQSASGVMISSAHPEPVQWTAKGRTSTGAWRLNRPSTRTDAELFLPPNEQAPAFRWWDTDVFLQVSSYRFDEDTGNIAFAIPGVSFTGAVRGAFHRIASPDVAKWIGAEVALSTTAIAALSVWRNGRYLGPGAIAITGASLVSVTSARNPPVAPYDFAPSPAIAWLQREAPGERVASLSRDTMTPNVNVLFGIRSTDLQDPLQDCRYQALVRSLAPPTTLRSCNGQNQTNLTPATPHAMRILGATTLVQSRTDADAVRRTTGRQAPDGFAVAFEDDDVTLYRLDGRSPRVRVTTAIMPLPSTARASLEAVIAPSFDPDRSVVVELDPEPTWLSVPRSPLTSCDLTNSRVADAVSTRPNQLANAHAAIIDEGWNQIAIDATAPAPAFISLAESYFPGWKATIDGRPVPICRGNLAMMAIPVPQGRTMVQLRFG
ncbi:MAG: YfhO family protein [Chloroflexi bacterium]|nr:YfhO family protein [Chloroflexota bacterium]